MPNLSSIKRKSRKQKKNKKFEQQIGKIHMHFEKLLLSKIINDTNKQRICTMRLTPALEWEITNLKGVFVPLTEQAL